MKEITSAPPNMPKLFKTIRDGQSCNGGNHTWSLPKDGELGEWTDVYGALKRCHNGFHLTTSPKSRWHGANEVYEVEVDFGSGVLMPDEQDVDNEESEGYSHFGGYETDEWVARRVRLVRRIEGEELSTMLRTVKPLDVIPERLFAVLEDATDPNTKFQWPVPKRKEPAEWAEWKGGPKGSTDILQSSDGLRLTTKPGRWYRKSFEVWEVEVEGRVWETDGGELRAQRARLIHRLSDKELDKLGVGVDRTYHRRRGWNDDRYSSIRKHDPKGMSPGEKFVRLMAEHGDVSTSRTVSDNEYRFVSEAMSLAIRGGLEFKGVGIFKDLAQDPNSFYGTAIEAGNVSACEVIEAALGRRPWVWQECRLRASSAFQWAGRTVTVTSFDDEKDQIVAYAHHEKVVVRHGVEQTQRLVAKRFTIQHAEFDDVAHRHKAFSKRSESFGKKVAWLLNVGLPNGYLRRLAYGKIVEHMTSLMWFWTPEQHAEFIEWQKTRKDATTHGKKRVGNEPPPAFVQLTADDALAGMKEWDELWHQAKNMAGAEPRYDSFKHEYHWNEAQKVWKVKFNDTLTSLLTTRSSTVGRFDRAMRAWTTTNFVGRPNDYLDVEGKGKLAKR